MAPIPAMMIFILLRLRKEGRQIGGYLDGPAFGRAADRPDAHDRAPGPPELRGERDRGEFKDAGCRGVEHGLVFAEPEAQDDDGFGDDREEHVHHADEEQAEIDDRGPGALGVVVALLHFTDDDLFLRGDDDVVAVVDQRGDLADKLGLFLGRGRGRPNAVDDLSGEIHGRVDDRDCQRNSHKDPPSFTL